MRKSFGLMTPNLVRTESAARSSVQSHQSQAGGCMRPCVLSPNNRTKMIHVKHFATITRAEAFQPAVRF
jgi:hypothetical protein